MITYLKALEEADKLRVRSAAIPAIGINAFTVSLHISDKAAAILMADGAKSSVNKLKFV